MVSPFTAGYGHHFHSNECGQLRLNNNNQPHLAQLSHAIFSARQPAAALTCRTASPPPASSGKAQRHRLNRGGDRAANSDLHIIAIGRLRLDVTTQTYVSRQVAEGQSKLEALRCLKRYIAREVYYVLAIATERSIRRKYGHLTLRRASVMCSPYQRSWLIKCQFFINTFDIIIFFFFVTRYRLGA
ncbi:hypothetical protein SAMN04487951_104103 [Vreelandella arcis]|uniref:Transposase IS116/IS110/IS902 family protein n=1 Tax=Vreelandella arcis TaxID=416873 RepID=A0A1H0AGE7_9GAMM|nr:hypothetical protein SAMN04487951_104103 [Halomonas arcis]